MAAETKTTQLQLRVSPAEKAAIRRSARQAGLGISEWVLQRLLPAASDRFQEIVEALAGATEPSYALAELNDLLSGLTARELSRAVENPPRARLEPYRENYVAAMIEVAAAKKGIESPAWTARVRPLAEPRFGASLLGLRLHLLTQSPPPFRARNIFVDSGVGDRV